MWNTEFNSLSYGYQSNTRVKFVLILALADAVVRDTEVKTASTLVSTFEPI